MPSIAMYLNEADARALLAWLAGSKEIAFLVPDGIGRWKAVSTISGFPTVPTQMWHITSGPLPLLAKEINGPTNEITSPWDGWTELRPGADKRLPYFGPGWPGVMTLEVRLLSKDGGREQSLPQAQEAIGLSSIGWIGNRYKSIGIAARPETEKFWKKLFRFIATHATLIPRSGPLNASTRKCCAYAFPSALEEIRNGRARALNPW